MRARANILDRACPFALARRLAAGTTVAELDVRVAGALCNLHLALAVDKTFTTQSRERCFVNNVDDQRSRQARGRWAPRKAQKREFPVGAKQQLHHARVSDAQRVESTASSCRVPLAASFVQRR